MSDFQDEIQKEERDNPDVIAIDLEEVPQLFGSDVDEVELSGFARLNSDEVFAFLVVVLAHDLQELEGSAIGRNAEFAVEELISGVGFRNVLSHGVLHASVEEVVVVDFVKTELAGLIVIFVLLSVGLVDTLSNQFAELKDECLDVGEDFAFLVLVQFFQDVLLSDRVAAQEVGDGAQQN